MARQKLTLDGAPFNHEEWKGKGKGWVIKKGKNGSISKPIPVKITEEDEDFICIKFLTGKSGYCYLPRAVHKTYEDAIKEYNRRCNIK